MDDYRCIREEAAIGAVAPRHQIAVAGPDRATYLQGLLTNDIPALSPGTGCYSAWLTPQGRMLTDMHVLESGSMILLDVPAETTEATRERLEQFIFTEDVQVASLAESLAGVWIHGPKAAAPCSRGVTASQRVSRRGRTITTRSCSSRNSRCRWRASISSVCRGSVSSSSERANSDLIAALTGAGARVVSPQAIEAARIEAGYPVFGVDMTDDTIPLEAGIEDRAISLTKGCYVGQEVIIRVLHRGHGRVVRKLVSLRIEGPAPPRGARLFAADRDVGFITSAAESPRLGTIAMGYLHRDFLAAGTKVEAATDAGRRRLRRLPNA